MNLYRSANSTESVYQLVDGAHVYIGNYYACGVLRSDSYAKAAQRVESAK